ncbi:MAG: glutathione binding-like protein, partial [Casimicrobiaceae bacterium]
PFAGRELACWQPWLSTRLRCSASADDRLFSLPHHHPMARSASVGFFHKFAGKHFEDKRPRDRYVAESKRLLAVLDARLTDRTWLMGNNCTIADIAVFPWVRNLIGFYEAGDLVGIAGFPQVTRALEAFLARPAVVRGLAVPGRE